MLDTSEVLRSAELHNLVPTQRPRVPAVCALDLEGGLEADKIGCRADMLCGHSSCLPVGEQVVNVPRS
jgi:hypothetical protein